MADYDDYEYTEEDFADLRNEINGVLDEFTAKFEQLHNDVDDFHELGMDIGQESIDLIHNLKENEVELVRDDVSAEDFGWVVKDIMETYKDLYDAWHRLYMQLP